MTGIHSSLVWAPEYGQNNSKACPRKMGLNLGQGRHDRLHPLSACGGRSMTIAEVSVFIVDDDASFRRAVQRLLHSVGLPVETFASRGSFHAVKP